MHGQKDRGRHDFSLIPNGAPGIETRLMLLHEEGVRRGRLTLDQFVDVTATQPARLFGLYPRKGTIAPGSDADLVVWDPAREVTLRAEARCTCGWTTRRTKGARSPARRTSSSPAARSSSKAAGSSAAAAPGASSPASRADERLTAGLKTRPH